jgi:acyl carrier protein
MAKNIEAFRKVVERLSRMTAPQKRALPITEDTEVYRDLEIYGDELVELIWWLEREFGVTPNVDSFKFAPREFPFSWALHAIRRVMGREPEYNSLKVRDIVAAIETKRWPE